MKIYNIYGTSINTQFQGVKKIPTKKQWNELKVFNHHIYEYEKGLRSLILTTEKIENRPIIEDRLNKRKIAYFIHELQNKNINVFFGNPKAVEVIRSFKQPELNKYTPEQDFILGVLLGYDKIQECERYLKLIKKA